MSELAVDRIVEGRGIVEGITEGIVEGIVEGIMFMFRRVLGRLVLKVGAWEEELLTAGSRVRVGLEL